MADPRTWLVVAVAALGAGCGTPAAKSASVDPLATLEAEPSESSVAEYDGPALTREEIRTVVRAKLPQIRACFEASLADDEPPALRSRVRLRFAIGPDGKARDPTIVEDQPGDPSVGACLVEQLQAWQFPHPREGRPVVITYPFAFSSEASLRAAGLPRVEGTIAPEAVGAVFEARRNELDLCIPDEAGGTIGVALTIDDGGAVVRISSYEDSLPDKAGSCVVRTISSWVFPPAAPGDEARVNHDLRW